MDIPLESNNELPLGKTFNMLDMIIMIIVAASAFEKKKIYPQSFLYECTYIRIVRI